jgi:t-SNARE complex subunit (syntaxin)
MCGDWTIIIIIIIIIIVSRLRTTNPPVLKGKQPWQER